MKHCLSVFALYVRMNLRKLLVLIIGMSAGQIAFFHTRLQAVIAYAESRPAAPEELMSYDLTRMEDMFSAPYLMIGGIAFLLLCTALCMAGYASSSKTGYTLARLGITERETFFVQSVANTLFFAMFLCVEALLSAALCSYYAMQMPYVVGGLPVVSGQSILLAFYRSDFLHALLPMSDGLGWSCSVLLLLSLGITTAGFPFLQRRGVFSSDIITTALVTLAYFGLKDASIGPFLVYFDGVIVIWHIIYKVYTIDATLEEEASWETGGGTSDEKQ